MLLHLQLLRVRGSDASSYVSSIIPKLLVPISSNISIDKYFKAVFDRETKHEGCCNVVHQPGRHNACAAEERQGTS